MRYCQDNIGRYTIRDMLTYMNRTLLNFYYMSRHCSTSNLMVYACLISCSLINKSKCHALAYFNLRWTCVVILHKVLSVVVRLGQRTYHDSCNSSAHRRVRGIVFGITCILVILSTINYYFFLNCITCKQRKEAFVLILQ